MTDSTLAQAPADRVAHRSATPRRRRRRATPPPTRLARRRTSSRGRSAPARRCASARPRCSPSLWLGARRARRVRPERVHAGDPLAGVPADKLQAPSRTHRFGTDQLGRDLYTRVVHGTAALAAGRARSRSVVGLVVGALLGLVAGFARRRGRRRPDARRRRAAGDPRPAALARARHRARLRHGQRRDRRRRRQRRRRSPASCAPRCCGCARAPYVEAALAGGARWSARAARGTCCRTRSARSSCSPPCEFGTAILAVSSLSFLGYGAPPPTPEWGSLVAEGRNYLATAWWLTTLPGLVVVAVVLAANRISPRARRGRERR